MNIQRKLPERRRGIASFVITMILAFASFTATAGKVSAGFTEHFATVNGTRLHYFIGGKGNPVVLLHGYAQTAHMWNPIMPLLATNHTVIVPDLRGAGDSSKPESGYDKKNMAVDIHHLIASLGLNRVSIVGHDIGLMVAYAYAAQFPQETERVVLMDAFLPGIGDWKNVWLMRDLWHFHFYGEVPLALVKDRERTYFEHFWNDFAELSAKPLPMPVLVLTGEKASGNFLIEQARLVATNVQGQIIPGSGHWLMEEAPQIVIPTLTAFLGDRRTVTSGLRLDAADIEAIPPTGAGTGTSGVSGIQTRLLRGNPTQPGAYSIQLNVPANTRIEAHHHPDDRFVTVISGTWHFGYGTRFDEKELKELSAGSFYTEPPNVPHFARTGGSPAVVQISGFGPSGTRYRNETATK